MPTILVVDDDATVREVVSGYLERAGLEVVAARDGLEAVETARVRRPDLVLLDLTLPGLDGLEVFRRIRAARSDLPVVMLTARGEESDRVLGLEIGADDYVTKPFSSRELVLRIQSILRRTKAPADSADADGILRDGDLAVDRRRHQARLAGDPLALTSREYDLLVHLMSHPGTAFSRRELMQQVWGWEYGDESTVTVHVRRLREKVETDPARPVRLQTVWGIGYRWDGAGDDQAVIRP
jgi:DNA-binding response OmpR family regulator